jgi:Flp pilus assembly pilin Flp
MQPALHRGRSKEKTRQAEGKKMQLLKRLWNEDKAVSATEYGIIAAIIAVGLITILFTFRNSLRNMFNRASDAVNAQ